MKEVELKIYLGPTAPDDLLELLSRSYGDPVVMSQEDIYYTGRFKDFIASEECLRIRKTDNKEEITWKPPTTDEMVAGQQYWKEERNIDISGRADDFRYLLERLDFIEYVTVVKRRAEFRVDGSTSVAVDNISGIGTFVEVETMADNHEIAVAKNLDELSKLGFENYLRVTRPYRDIVKDGQIEVSRAERKG